MRYAVVIEGVGGNYCAYSPDLPGCIATGCTVEEAKQTMQLAMRMHLRSLLADSRRMPEPCTEVTYLDTEACAL